MDNLRHLIEGKKVVVIGSTPPSGVDFSEYDYMVRCNDWWAYDEGRCDILFHIGASAKIKPSYLLNNEKLFKQLKLLCLYEDGGESNLMQQAAGFHDYPVDLYSKKTPFLYPLRRSFEIRGNSPSTGLIASFACSKMEPAKLLVTGSDLYSSEPDHIGWEKHNPYHHVEWYQELDKLDFVEIGKDLQRGMHYWQQQDFWGVKSEAKSSPAK